MMINAMEHWKCFQYSTGNALLTDETKQSHVFKCAQSIIERGSSGGYPSPIPHSNAWTILGHVLYNHIATWSFFYFRSIYFTLTKFILVLARGKTVMILSGKY